MKYMREFRSHFMKKPAFTAREVQLFLENRESSPGYYKLVIHNLLSRREIYRITRGVYTFQEDAQMSGFGFSPFYYGLEDALSLRNVWEQETNPVIITPRKVRVCSSTGFSIWSRKTESLSFIDERSSVMLER